MSSGGSAHIESTITSILGKDPPKKAQMVPSWKGCLDQRWLLVLNKYPLAEDTEDVTSIVGELARSEPEIRRLDGILWDGRPSSDLVSIWQRRGTET